MKNFLKERAGVLEVLVGSDIRNCIAEAIELAVKEKREIMFLHSDVIVRVVGDSDPKRLHRKWSRERSRLRVAMKR